MTETKKKSLLKKYYAARGGSRNIKQIAKELYTTPATLLVMMYKRIYPVPDRVMGLVQLHKFSDQK